MVPNAARDYTAGIVHDIWKRVEGKNREERSRRRTAEREKKWLVVDGKSEQKTESRAELKVNDEGVPMYV